MKTTSERHWLQGIGSNHMTRSRQVVELTSGGWWINWLISLVNSFEQTCKNSILLSVQKWNFSFEHVLVTIRLELNTKNTFHFRKCCLLLFSLKYEVNLLHKVWTSFNSVLKCRIAFWQSTTLSSSHCQRSTWKRINAKKQCFYFPRLICTWLQMQK